MERRELLGLSREELIARAEQIGVQRPRALTAAELTDEILARSAKSDGERRRVRGWLGRARDLLASVVERGLHLPDTAKVLRNDPDPSRWPSPPSPLPTMTLAEIYAAQGHLDKAVHVLDELIAREPEHKEANALRDRLRAQRDETRRRTSPPPRGEDGASAGVTHHDPAVAVHVKGELHASKAVNAEAGVAVPEGGEGDAVEATDLPDRYDVDEVVALAVDPTTVYLYWEVRPTTLAHARTRHPNGRLVIRIVTVVASWNGPETATRDEDIDALYGDRFVYGVTPGANVRVTVGFRDQLAFEPFAVGVEVSVPRRAPAPDNASAIGRWTPAGAPLISAPQLQNAGLSTALDRARDQRRLIAPELPLGGALLEDEESIVIDDAGRPRVVKNRRREGWRALGASDLTRWQIEEEWIEEGPEGRRVVRWRRRIPGASEMIRGGASERSRR